MIERFKVSHPAFTSFSGDQEEVVRYTEGVCDDGAAILDEGRMIPIEEVLATLNRHAAEVERLERERDALKLQAQSWAIEARGANATVAEAYQAVTEAKGEPGNWHGAEPVKSKIAELTARAESAEANLRAVQTELARLQDEKSRATVEAKWDQLGSMPIDAELEEKLGHVKYDAPQAGGEMVTDAMVEALRDKLWRIREFIDEERLPDPDTAHPNDRSRFKDRCEEHPKVLAEIDALRAALSASPRREGWQSMETAEPLPTPPDFELMLHRIHGALSNALYDEAFEQVNFALEALAAAPTQGGGK